MEDPTQKWNSQSYTIKLNVLCIQMDDNEFRPYKIQRTLHFKRGLKETIRGKMSPQARGYNDLDEAISEASSKIEFI